MARVKGTFRRDRDHRLVTATGVYGGVAPHGDILADFFVERQEWPEAVTYEFDDRTHLGREIEHGGPNPMVREVQVTVLLRPDRAYSIGKWLIEKAKEAGVQEAEGD